MMDPHDWLLEVGKGWRPLVEPLIKYCVDNKIDIGQVKEKFGGLRFYVDGPEPPELEEMVRAAEAKSIETCEECGEPGEPGYSEPRGYWIKTRCDKCRKSFGSHT